MKAKMMDPVASCVEICVSPGVLDHYRLGHLEVLQDEVLAEDWDPPECSDDGPFLEGWRLLDGATYAGCDALGGSHNDPLVLEFPSEVETSTVASSLLVHVEVSQFFFKV